ncbi:hypothetical protein HOF78_03790 [Candidatus Woesearchaeota archaeon]|jgi:hypothetical protein|nr:hypothetical protein [Candidatus Woesearchaeota archaeon]MBT6044734.1 hypothetical protein [Candidatus Woesearchaeota archaeon]
MKTVLKNVFEMFSKEKINYVVLRGYSTFDDGNDIDILVENKCKVRNLLKELGFKKRADFGYYLTFKGEYYLDLRVKVMPYQGFPYASARDLLSRRKKRSYFYTLSEEDELIHLVLHCVIDKRHFSEKHLVKIKKLVKTADKKVVLSELKTRLGDTGGEVSSLLYNGDFNGLKLLRSRLMIKMVTLKGIYNWLVVHGIRLVRRIF